MAVTKRFTPQEYAELDEVRARIPKGTPAKERGARLAAKRAEILARHEPKPQLEPGQSAAPPEENVPREIHRRILPPGRLTWVDVDLPGWEGTQAGYNLDAQWAVRERLAAARNDGEVWRCLMTLVPVIRNAPEDPLTGEALRMPEYGDVAAYGAVYARFSDLAVWFSGQGWIKALGASVKN